MLLLKVLIYVQELSMRKMDMILYQENLFITFGYNFNCYVELYVLYI